jgi:hypothetical protein
MTTRMAGRRLLSLSARVLTGVVAAGAGLAACYSAGSGSDPPADQFYYPVGLAVSTAGDVLYVANSDFDLQWNGGTLQSYDLTHIRGDTAKLVGLNLHPASLSGADAGIPFVFDQAPCSQASTSNPVPRSGGMRVPLGASCAPPVDATHYFRASAIIGAFASDLQLSSDGRRLFVPVRGDATLTWADALAPSDPLGFQCGQGRSGGRCDAQHHTGNDPNGTGNSRHLTLPGEPFGMAQSQDVTAIVIAHQATPEASVLLARTSGGAEEPSMQFVLEGMPLGGNGIAPVPHDPDAVRRCEDVGNAYPCVRQAFLETSRSAAEIDLVRYYADDGNSLGQPSLRRPFIAREVAYPVTVNSPGGDQRGIAIDPTPRLKCKARAGAAPGSPDAVTCGQRPARVFIGSRSPASVIYGTIGGFSPSGDGTYDPDQLHLTASVPVLAGPSRLYLAPIVDATGHYALRLFVVCYDSAVVFVFDPDQVEALGQLAVPEAVLYVGPGPFAMAFDPFCGGLVDASGKATPSRCGPDEPFGDVALSEVHAGEPAFLVPADPKLPAGVRAYRFAYLTSFTQSYLQVIDLDDSPQPPPGQSAPPRSQRTFEQIVYTLGKPTPPKGT